MSTPDLRLPSEWAEHYTEAERADVARVLAWLHAGVVGRSQAQLARMARVAASTVNQVLRGVYTTPPRPILDKLLDTLRTAESRDLEVTEVPYVETTMTRIVATACRRARLHHSISVVAAFVGTGKTRALKEYAAANTNTHLVEATSTMSASSLLVRLVRLVRADVPTSASLPEREDAMIARLTGSESLLIIDEAETVPPRVLETLRRIHDLSGIGLVFAGTQTLSAILRRERGQFDQIRSRVGFWPPTVEAVSADDVAAICAAGLPEVEWSPELLVAMGTVCAGSARVLVRGLIPGIRDYVIARDRDLTPQMIRTVGRQALVLAV